MLDLSEGRPGCQCNGLLPRARLHPRPHAASLPCTRVHWAPSSQQAVRRTPPPNPLRRNRRCCALVRDDPRARRRHQGTRSHTRYSAPHPCRPPPWHRLRPRALAPLCFGEAAGIAAALRSAWRAARSRRCCLVAEGVAPSRLAPCQSCHVPQPGKLPARASWWVLVQVLGGLAGCGWRSRLLRAWLRVGCVQAVLSVQSVECVGEEVLSRWLEVSCVLHYKVH